METAGSRVTAPTRASRTGQHHGISNCITRSKRRTLIVFRTGSSINPGCVKLTDLLLRSVLFPIWDSMSIRVPDTSDTSGISRRHIWRPSALPGRAVSAAGPDGGRSVGGATATARLGGPRYGAAEVARRGSRLGNAGGGRRDGDRRQEGHGAGRRLPTQLGRSKEPREPPSSSGGCSRPGSGVPLYRQIYRSLRAAILSGWLEPGYPHCTGVYPATRVPAPAPGAACGRGGRTPRHGPGDRRGCPPPPGARGAAPGSSAPSGWWRGGGR